MSTIEREIAEQPLVLQRLIGRETWDGLTRKIASRAHEGALTVARGSSDHAAVYFSYLVLVHAKLPVASIPPSVATLYGRRPRGQGNFGESDIYGCQQHVPLLSLAVPVE